MYQFSAWLSREVPFFRRWIRRMWYESLAKWVRAPEWTMMNFGFADPESNNPLMPLEPEQEPERYCLQLYHHVVGDIQLNGRDVLEVGCGRGGGAVWLHHTYGPSSYTAMDYSRQAIRLCKNNYQQNGIIFAHGDAESIPFPENSFDVVINVESSHCYRSMPAFLENVKRVLRPGGHFLFTDFRHGDQTAVLQKQLTESGLKLLSEQDITANIIRGLELDYERKLVFIQTIAPRWMLKLPLELAGGKDSFIWKGLVSGHSRYLSAVLQHPVE